MKKLWSANKSQIINSNLFNYENYISKRYKTNLTKIIIKF